MSNPGSGHLPWYAVRVRSNSEVLASEALRGRGFETLSPSFREKRRWSDRVKEIDRPLFPGYVFCRLDMRGRTPVLQSPGVVELVSVGKIPAALDEGEIEAVRTVAASGAAVQPCAFVHQGDRVKIGGGPLRGAEGIVANIGNCRRFVVSVGLLQRSISVEMDEVWLRPAN